MDQEAIKLRAVTPITVAFPDGKEHIFRYSPGAMNRLVKRFGVEFDLMELVKAHGPGVLPEVAYNMMYDDKGKPPAGVTLAEMEENISPDGQELFIAIMAALNQGRLGSPNEMLARAKTPTPMTTAESTTTSSGSSTGDSPSIASESTETNIGTDTSGAKSMHLVEPTEPKSEDAPTA